MERKLTFCALGILCMSLFYLTACEETDNDPTTVTDIDGNVYKTVTIGSQVWMAENLKTTKFRNGDPIPLITDAAAWASSTTGAYCNYDNDEANAEVYGRLYDWKSANDPRGICPEGWHIPTDAEWGTLIAFLGGDAVAGGKLKEKGTVHWNSPNNQASDTVGFTALPAGERRATGQYIYLKQYGCWWSSTETDDLNAWIRYISNSTYYITRQIYSKKYAYSVRCIKD